MAGRRWRRCRTTLSRYPHSVVSEEWSFLARESTSAADGLGASETIYLSILDLVPTTPRETALRDHMIDGAERIAALRQLRENMSAEPVDPLFWFAALAGVDAGIGAHSVPAAVNMLLLSVYGAFTGIVMFIIFALSDPFSPPGLLDPIAMERLLKTEIGDGP